MKIVTFDLETVPDDSERSETIRRIVREGMGDDPAGWKHDEAEAEMAYRAATTPEFCRVVAAAYAVNEESPAGAAVGQTGRDGDAFEEADLLRALWARFEGAGVVVSFNGLWFDLRVLKFRSALLGVEPSRPDWVDLKPWDTGFVDVFRSMYPNRKYTLSLKRAAHAFNLPVPAEFAGLFETEPDGSAVAGLWADGRLSELVAYNRMDVALTRELYRLFGGFYWPVGLTPWGKDYDYLRGAWTGEVPVGF